MIQAFLAKIFGSRNDRLVKSMTKAVAKINAFEAGIKALSDAEIKAKTDDFRARIAKGESLDSVLPEAFACSTMLAILVNVLLKILASASGARPAATRSLMPACIITNSGRSARTSELNRYSICAVVSPPIPRFTRSYPAIRGAGFQAAMRESPNRAMN